MSELKQQTPLFFIVGRARSGTTLLRILLDAHPSVIIPFECPFIQHMASRYASKNEWSQHDLLRFCHDLEKQPGFGLLNIRKKDLKDKILQAGPDVSFAELCKLTIRLCQSVFPKNEILLLGDKNPGYSLVLPTLANIFPDARFIHMTRDYRDNILSMQRVDFESHWTASLACRWKYYNQTIDRFKRKNPDRFFSLKYEDLVAEPENRMREVCRFLSLPFEPCMMNFSSSKSEHYKVYPPEAMDRYHGHLFAEISADHVYGWKKKMSDKVVRKSDSVVGDFAEYFGYERKFKKNSLFVRLAVLPGILYGRLYFVWGRCVNALPFGFRMAVIQMLARIFNPYWRRYKVKQD